MNKIHKNDMVCLQEKKTIRTIFGHKVKSTHVFLKHIGFIAIKVQNLFSHRLKKKNSVGFCTFIFNNWIVKISQVS